MTRRLPVRRAFGGDPRTQADRFFEDLLGAPGSSPDESQLGEAITSDEHREADLFFAELTGEPLTRRRRATWQGESSEQDEELQAALLTDPREGSAPQLARALLESKAGQWDAYRTQLEKDGAKDPGRLIALDKADSFAKDLNALLTHVQQRIEGGLDEAWMSEAGYAWRPPPTAQQYPSKKDLEDAQRAQAQYQANLLRLYNDPEEKWARALTETFVFLMYGGPDVIYSIPAPNGIVLRDKDFYAGFARLGSGPGKGTYPLAAACQQLSTFAVLSRGRTVDEVDKNGLSCSGVSAKLPAFKKGIKLERKGQCGTTSCILGKVGPSDAVFFNFRGPAETSQAPKLSAQDQAKGIKAPGLVHVGTVLRKWGNKLQYFDTGVLTSSGHGSIEGGTTDHDWAAETMSAYTDLVGIGAQGDAPKNLGELADNLSSARPLAVARLVVFDERNNDVRKHRVRYVSRLLHLVHQGRGIPLSKLVWSVRNPPTKGVRLGWWVYVPKGKWVERFTSDDAPTKPVAQLLKPQNEGDSLYDCNIIIGKPDGGVAIYRRFEKETKDGAKSGWSRDFGVDASLASAEVPWMAFRGAPPFAFTAWSTTRKAHGKAYRVVNPADLTGEEFEDKVGVALFDQGL